MASRNGFRALGSVGILALLASFVLGGCAAGTEPTAEEAGATPSDASAAVFTPEPKATEIASTGGSGTAISFPISTPPSFQPATEPADRGKVYGSPAYPHYGDNVPIHINLAAEGEEAHASSDPKAGEPTAGQ